MPRTAPKNKYKARPHSQWMTVPVEWKQLEGEDFTMVGYASVWGSPPDEHGDIVTKGAFAKTIKERISKGIVPLLDSHIYDSSHTLGTVVKAEEDAHGLKIWAKLSRVPTVQEVRQKMLEGHLSKLSIGYDAVKERYARDEKTGKTVRYLDEVKLFEISVVPIPALDRSSILSVKTVVPYQDFPIADRERPWDSTAAEQRVREAYSGTDDTINFTRYRRAFMWYDQSEPELLGSYKLQIADIIDGRLTAVPRAIFAVAGVLRGARGGVDIPQEDQNRIKDQVSRYYAKMRNEFDDDSIVTPWDEEQEASSKEETIGIIKKSLETESLSDEDLVQFFNSVRQMWMDFPQPDNQLHLAGMGSTIVSEMFVRNLLNVVSGDDPFYQAALRELVNPQHLIPMEEEEEEDDIMDDLDDMDDPYDYGAVPGITSSHTPQEQGKSSEYKRKLYESKLRLEVSKHAKRG